MPRAISENLENIHDGDSVLSKVGQFLGQGNQVGVELDGIAAGVQNDFPFLDQTRPSVSSASVVVSSWRYPTGAWTLSQNEDVRLMDHFEPRLCTVNAP